MSDAVRLALALAADEPEAAGSVLAGLPPGEVAAFLAAMPEDDVPEILEHLPAPFAADCLEPLPPETASSWLIEVGYPLRTQIARALAPEALGRILAAMPRSRANQIGRDLAYSPDSAGAWMETAVSVVTESETVGPCLARLRRIRRALDPTLVVVAETGRAYVGLVHVSTLLGASDKRTVGRLADRDTAPLDAEISLTEAALREDWTRYLALPVVGRRKQVLGILRVGRLKAGLADTAIADVQTGSDLLPHLLEAALVGAAGLSLLLPPAPRREDE